MGVCPTIVVDDGAGPVEVPIAARTDWLRSVCGGDVHLGETTATVDEVDAAFINHFCEAIGALACAELGSKLPDVWINAAERGHPNGTGQRFGGDVEKLLGGWFRETFADDELRPKIDAIVDDAARTWGRDWALVAVGAQSLYSRVPDDYLFTFCRPGQPTVTLAANVNGKAHTVGGTAVSFLSSVDSFRAGAVWGRKGCAGRAAADCALAGGRVPGGAGKPVMVVRHQSGVVTDVASFDVAYLTDTAGTRVCVRADGARQLQLNYERVVVAARARRDDLRAGTAVPRSLGTSLAEIVALINALADAKAEQRPRSAGLALDGWAIRKRRERRGYDVTEVADRIGVSVRTLVGWEEGDIPRCDNEGALSALCDVLECDILAVLFGDGE